MNSEVNGILLIVVHCIPNNLKTLQYSTHTDCHSKHATTEELLEVAFSIQPDSRLYSEWFSAVGVIVDSQ
jgi:hypothetical protein